MKIFNLHCGRPQLPQTKNTDQQTWLTEASYKGNNSKRKEKNETLFKN